MASGFSKAPIFSSLRAGRQTPTESDSSRPESNSTSTVISRSTRGCRLPPTISGRWAIAPAAPIYACPFDDFRVVYDNLNGGNRTIKNRLVPFCMFTDPELARVGRNESAARRDGIEYRVAKMRTADVLRTRTVSEPRGFLKVLIGANSDEILGFTAFGFEASEPMAAVQTAMMGRMPYTILRFSLIPRCPKG